MVTELIKMQQDMLTRFKLDAHIEEMNKMTG